MVVKSLVENIKLGPNEIGVMHVEPHRLLKAYEELQELGWLYYAQPSEDGERIPILVFNSTTTTTNP